MKKNRVLTLSIFSNYNQLLDFNLKKRIVLCIIFSIFEVFPVLGATVLIQHALNTSVRNGDFPGLLWDGFGVILCTGLVFIAAFLNNKIALQVNREVSRALYQKIADKCLRLNPLYFQKNGDDLVNYSVAKDAESVHNLGLVLFTRLIPSVLVSLSIFIFLSFLSLPLTIFLVISFPFFFLLSRNLEKKIQIVSLENRKSIVQFTEGIHFLFDMMDLIQTQSTQEIELKKHREKLDRMNLDLEKTSWIKFFYNLCQNFLISILSISILVIGGAMVIQNTLNWGHLIGFYIALGMLKRYLHILITSIPNVMDGNLAFLSIKKFLDQPELSFYQGEERILFQGGLQIKNLSFGFLGKPLFKNIDLSVGKGEIVALLGANGSGKSTIANLILGFHRPQQGALYFDSRPIESLDLIHLRQLIGIVRQNPLLFPGTIRDNIVYGLPNISLGEVEEAAALVGLSSFIENLPNRFNTQIGISGLFLSGGQKQKIALARAIIRKPKLLILDEPTNHLDTGSIQLMIDHLKTCKKEMSILLISHHQDLASLADKIYQFDEGSLIEMVPSRM